MHSNKKTYLVIAMAVMLPNLLLAATANSDKGGNYNTILISLVGLMVILLFVIGILANTLRMLSFVIKDKNRKERRSASTVVKSILLLLALGLPAVNAMASGTEKAATHAPDFISGMPASDFYAIMAVILLEIVVIFALVIQIGILLKVISGKPEAVVAGEAAVARESWFWDKFNAAVPIEKEKDLLMDHNYDGIRELDNSLPPWWKYGFYLTILVAVVYLYRFHVSHDGPSSHEEFIAAMQQADEEKAEYLKNAGNNVDENTVTLLTDPNEVAAGKDIFVKTCAPCHMPDGGGNVGPNLTDDYWLHGGTVKDVFKSIKYGWQDKGMKSWKDDFTPKQIQELASFVKSLKGTKPLVAKAPQGELFLEGTAPAADSTRKTTDTTQAKKK